VRQLRYAASIAAMSILFICIIASIERGFLAFLSRFAGSSNAGIPASVPAPAQFLIGVLQAFAPILASLAFTAALEISNLTSAQTCLMRVRLACWDRIRSDKHPKAEQQCQTNSNQNIRS
jgi:hypothetical protein